MVHPCIANNGNGRNFLYLRSIFWTVYELKSKLKNASKDKCGRTNKSLCAHNRLVNAFFTSIMISHCQQLRRLEWLSITTNEQ